MPRPPLPFPARARAVERLLSMLERLDERQLFMALAYLEQLSGEPPLIVDEPSAKVLKQRARTAWNKRRNAWAIHQRSLGKYPLGADYTPLSGERFNRHYEKVTGDRRPRK